jgi:NAD-dependent dihydropyrimidine dehydrogenase PreA subunit
MPRIHINKDLCERCGFCVEICPEELFVRKKQGTVPRIIRKADCISCGHCVSTCKANAIEHSDFPEDAWLRPRED